MPLNELRNMLSEFISNRRRTASQSAILIIVRIVPPSKTQQHLYAISFSDFRCFGEKIPVNVGGILDVQRESLRVQRSEGIDDVRAELSVDVIR